MRAKQLSTVLLALAGMLPLAPASAAITWTFTGGTCSGGVNFGNSCTWTGNDGSTTLTATAWSNTNAGSQVTTAYLANYSGNLGVTNKAGGTGGADPGEPALGSSTPPEHAMDNDGFTDAMVFGFSQAVDLASVKTGYPNGTASGNCGVSGFTCDSDITVLVYTGSGNPTTNGNLANLTYSQLLTHSWALVGNYADVAGLPNSTATVANSTYSNYWLVSAYNTPISGSALSGGNDYVKVLALTGDKTKQTPEPATMLLVGSAAAAGFWVRRRRRILPRTVEIC